MTKRVSGASSSDSDVPATARSFDAIEQQLLELRRSLGMDEGSRARPTTPVATPVHVPESPPAPAPVPVRTPLPEPESPAEPQPDVEPEPAAPSGARVGPLERHRRGLGADLVLLAGAWAGLIVLVAFVLDRAS